MDHRLIAAFAVLVSVVSVIGILSISDDSEVDASTTIDYDPEGVIDFSADESIYINVTVVQGGVTLIEMPAVYPEDFPDFDSFSNGSSGIHYSLDFAYDVWFYEDSVRLLVLCGDNAVSGTLNIHSGSYWFYFKVTSEEVPGFEQMFDFNYYDRWFSSYHGYVLVGSPSEFELDVPGVSITPITLNSNVGRPLASFSLSDDGSSVTCTVPEYYDSYSQSVHSVFIQTSESSPYGSLMNICSIPSSVEVVNLVPEVTLVLNEPIDDCCVFSVSPTVYMDFVYSDLPSGVGFGTSQYGRSGSSFDMWGTPTVTGTFEVTVSGSEQHFDSVSIDPVTFVINVLERFTVSFYDSEGSILLESGILDGDPLVSTPVVSVPEGMEFSGWAYYEGDSLIVFDPFLDVITSDLQLYPQFAESIPEPEPELPVSDGVVSNDPPEDGMDVPLGLLIILGLVVVVGLVAVAGGRRQ